MAKPILAPPVWGTAGNYPASVFPLTFPWGDAHPQAGLPTPWSGQPRLNATGLTSFAADGATPQVPQDASVWNEHYTRVTDAVIWVLDGSNAADADAHIMETTAAGLSRAVAYEATAGYQNSGPGPAVMLMGWTVPASETSTLTDDAEIVGGTGSKIDVEIVEQTTSRFDDSGTTLPPNTRDMHWLETIEAVRMPDGGGGTVRARAIPATGNDVLFSSSAAIEDTTAAATIRAFETEPLLVTVKFGYRHTAGAATGNMNTRIQFQGPTDEDEFIETWELESSIGWLPFSQDYVWQPDDTFVSPGTRNYSVLLRAGSSLGANLELRNIVVQVRSAFQI